MPRLHGYRERLYVNLYDAVPIAAMETHHAELFRDNAHIGLPHLSNLTIPGELGADATFVIINAYTRTNLGRPRPVIDDNTRNEVRALFADGNDGDALGTLMRDLQWERTPLVRALEEWAHSAVVEIFIGVKPMLTMNFHDLMDGPAVGPGRAPDRPLAQDEQLPWRKQLGRPLIVPVRQKMHAVIKSEERSLRALQRLSAAAGIVPDPLVWVHLEGLQTRDCC